ncbi:MAG: biotin transporter BioY, partial [Candidatus Omnitrophota bacterium]
GGLNPHTRKLANSPTQMEMMIMKELTIDRSESVILTKFLGVCVFTAALCFSALVKVPLFFTPVPITLQTMIVCLSGAVLGPRCGVAAVVSYLALGLFGVPLFTQAGSGLLYFFGPTGGYLIGFLLASLFVGKLAQSVKTNSLVIWSAVMFVGMLAIYSVGALWLKVGYGWTLKNIIFLGVLPFVVPDMFKAIFAALIYRRFKS